MLRLTMTAAALVAVAHSAVAQPTGSLPPNPAQSRLTDPGLKHVPTDSFMFVSVKISKLWDSPAAKPFRDWVATQQKDGVLDSMVGLPLSDIDRVTFVVSALDSGNDEDEPFAIVTTREKYSDAAVLRALAGGLGDGKPLKLTGRAAQLPYGHGLFHTVILANDRTLVFTKVSLDEKQAAALVARLAPRKGVGPLSDPLAQAAAHDIAAGANLKALEPLAPKIAKDEGLAPFLVLLKAKTVTFTADVGKTANGKLVMTFPDAATAKLASKALEDGMKLAADELARRRIGDWATPVERFVFGRFVDVLKSAKVAVDGSNLVATGDVPYADEFAKLVGELPKSLKADIIDGTAKNNVKQLALAMHNFESANGYLPGEVAGDKNKPFAWGWRLHVLPYLEQGPLYNKLDTTKPWDDPVNLKVLEEMPMPKVFEHPGRPAPKGHTYFRIFSLPKGAKGTDLPLFEEGKRGPRITDVTDGLSNTLMIVEAGEAVPWYKPDVLAYDGKLPLPQLGDKDADLFLAALADGSVRTFKPNKLGEKTLRALITRAGGEVIPDIDR
ncbi:DUF1559 family PulG-like putative transporter [Gemmata sp.]|uniref:DUF1559 family PulG-like putative transporter n=1 Tax=Gemmata sp. TaxID=1914242 RepID=UPI003F700014